MRVSNMTVYRLIHSGELYAIQAGRSFRIPKAAFDAYLENAVYEPEASYAEQVKAPFGPATLAALNDELESGDYARYQKAG
jgi:excisionase family DNA binding protein